MKRMFVFVAGSILGLLIVRPQLCLGEQFTGRIVKISGQRVEVEAGQERRTFTVRQPGQLAVSDVVSITYEAHGDILLASDVRVENEGPAQPR